MDNVLLYFALKYQGDWEKIYAALDKKEKIDHDDFVDVASSIKANFISIINPLYPTSLKNSHKPPFVLFTEGDLNLLTNYHQIIGISGDAKSSKYGDDATTILVKDFAKEKRIILLSDEAGIEHTALQEAVENKAKVILVTRSGLMDFISKNSKTLSLLRKTEYLLISESYENVDLEKLHATDYFFRLKAGIAKAFVIVQATMKSACMSIVTHALNDGKDIFVIPEDINSSYKGSNFLIKQGAKLIENSSDVLNEL